MADRLRRPRRCRPPLGFLLLTRARGAAFPLRGVGLSHRKGRIGRTTRKAIQKGRVQGGWVQSKSGKEGGKKKEETVNVKVVPIVPAENNQDVSTAGGGMSVQREPSLHDEKRKERLNRKKSRKKMVVPIHKFDLDDTGLHDSVRESSGGSSGYHI